LRPGGPRVRHDVIDTGDTPFETLFENTRRSDQGSASGFRSHAGRGTLRGWPRPGMKSFSTTSTSVAQGLQSLRGCNTFTDKVPGRTERLGERTTDETLIDLLWRVDVFEGGTGERHATRATGRRGLIASSVPSSQLLVRGPRDAEPASSSHARQAAKGTAITTLLQQPSSVHCTCAADMVR